MSDFSQLLRTILREEPLPAIANWEALTTLILHERVSAQARRILLAKTRWQEIPAPLQTKITLDALTRTAHAGLLQHFLAEFLQAAHNRFPVIVLKGAALASQLYQQPNERTLNDLDLLVREQDVPAAVQVLTQLGLQRAEWVEELLPDFVHLTAYHRIYRGRANKQVEVELHWSVIANPHDPIAPDLEWLWQNTIPFGEFARQFSPTANALYLPAHIVLGATENFQFSACLLWFQDLARLIERFSDEIAWEVVLEKANAWGWNLVLLEAYRALQARFPVSLPQDFLARLEAAVNSRDKTTFADYKNNRNHAFERVWRYSDWRNRLQLVRGYLFPSAEFLRWRYPSIARASYSRLLFHRWYCYLRLASTRILKK